MMEKAWISNVTSGCRSAVFSVILVTSVAGCVAQKPSETLSFVEPPMQWDAHPEAEEWTDSTLVALSTKDPILSEKIPADIETWCPGYADAPIEARRAFWAGLMSSVAKYESTWNPQA
ncbi:MAG: lytic transglycosylase, partial [Tabrizicola sp.]|nr:lytic transglycosylase [Tabrizicola sp.]